MKNLGDITKLNGAEIPFVDIITGGSPCQDLSIAGKRKGLAGERSGLFMDQMRLIKEQRNETKRLFDKGAIDSIRPRFMVWENVPGAFSSNKGEDFRCVLEETAKVVQGDACIPGPPGDKWPHSGCIMGDGWSIAWRVHDAQFWGVPQRRKRIALVADFGGESAPEILFERKGMSGDITESGKEGEGAASDAGAGIEKTSRAISFQERAGNMTFEPGATSRLGGHCYNNMCGTLRADMGDNQPAVCYGIGSYDSYAMKSDNPHSGVYEADTSRTLDLNGGNPACNQGGMAVVQKSAGFCPEESAKTRGIGYEEENAPSLRSGVVPGVVCLNDQGGMAVVYRGDAITSPINASNPKPGDPCHTLTDDSRNYVVLENHPADSRVKISEDGVVQTLSSRMGTGGGNVPMVFSEVAAARCAQDGRGGVHTQMMSDPESNFVLESVSFGNGQLHDAMLPSVEISKTLNCMADPAKIVAYGLDRASFNQGKNAKYDFSVDEEKVGPQIARGPGAVISAQNSIVRRLTPLECERLQGYPDGWTDIGEWVDSKGKKRKDSDSPRYKALGNSIALPFWQWMAHKMVKYIDGHQPTMASLFDGIGGFPLVFSRAGAKPIWASEIEEFPIAVTKIRFPEEKENK